MERMERDAESLRMAERINFAVWNPKGLDAERAAFQRRYGLDMPAADVLAKAQAMVRDLRGKKAVVKH